MKRFLTIALALVCAMLTFAALAENVPPVQTTSIPAQTAEPLTGSAAPVSGTPAPGTAPAGGGFGAIPNEWFGGTNALPPGTQVVPQQPGQTLETLPPAIESRQ